MKLTTLDMPKLESPFERQEVNGQYVCIPKIKEDYHWVFEDSIAVEKLDGTNVSLWIQNGRPKAIKNRDTEIDIWSKGGISFFTGITTAIKRGYISPSICGDGGYYGELCDALWEAVKNILERKDENKENQI